MTELARPLVVLSDLHLSHGATAATAQALTELMRRYPLVEGAGVTGQVEPRKGKPKQSNIIYE